MFQIDRSKNSLQRLEKRRFADEKIREREELQEWLAATPDALGEDLLIIQKEFDEFEDTRERLDLLALDKQGQLVIIENKLDDSGRDVVWQAIKYSAYCSSLKKVEIIEIYQRYLDKYCGGGDAGTKLSEFFDDKDLEEMVLNPGNRQRVILIAANFRKEVTSTALWLLGHGIQVQCFRAVLYKFSNEQFIDFLQIIPTPEAQNYMIGMANKETEEKSTQNAQEVRHGLRLDFWQQVLDEFRVRGIARYQNISPSKDHWLNASTGLRDCAYSLIFTKNEIRVELLLQRNIADENKKIFDRLYNNKEDLERQFGSPLVWKRLDDKISSKICFSKSFNGFDRENWPEMIEWMADYFGCLEKTFAEPLNNLKTKF